MFVILKCHKDNRTADIPAAASLHGMTTPR